MVYSDKFLNELRDTVKEMLLKGDILQISKVKELLEYSNITFGDFIAPLLKDGCSVSSIEVEEGAVSDDGLQDDLVSVGTEVSDNQVASYSLDAKVTDEFSHGHSSEDGTYAEVSTQEGYLESKENKTPTHKYMSYFHRPTSAGKLEGVVVYKLKAFIIEDLVTGEVLYKNSHYISHILGLSHGDVISFNILDDYRLVDITREAEYDFKDGIQVVTNCPIFKDENGFYVPTDMMGGSLTKYGSHVSPYNIPCNVVDAFGIQEDDSVDLYIQPDSIPYVLYVNRGFYKSMGASALEQGTNSASKSTKGTTKSAPKTYQKYDFDLKGKTVGFIGVPTSQKARVESLCKEKGAEGYEFIDSSSHMETESIPLRFADLDIIIIVKRFVGHGTIYNLKGIVQGSDVSVVNTSSHSVDAIERALYRGAKGYPSEEGTVTVNYPLLKG